MTSSSPARCPRCGTTIPPRAALGLCPACLFGTALARDAPDEEIGLPYRIVTLLGGDADAVTYLAQTLSGAPKHVALKILRSCHEPDAVVARFEQWKRALAGVRHPSVAPLVDAGRLDDGSIYLAGKYVAGAPLRSILETLGRDDRADVINQLTSGLRAAHGLGLAHMRLDASRIKVAASGGLRAVMLGLGSALVVEGLAPDPVLDRAALARIAADADVPMSPSAL